MITFQREYYATVVDDIKVLLEEHWLEVANYQDEIKLNPDYEKYLATEKRNALVIVTARKDGALVGYSIFILHNMIHYKDYVMASNDVLFLTASERRGTCGIKLIKESEKVLVSIGVRRIGFHLKPKKDFGAILARMGYLHEEIMMGKLLGD